MKNQLIILLCVMFLALLSSCQAPTAEFPHDSGESDKNIELIEDVPNLPKDEPEILSKQNDSAETEIESVPKEQEHDVCVLKSFFFETIDELIAFNKNPSLLNTGNSDQTAWLLAEHKAGTILSKDYIYIPEIADVSDYILNESYFLYGIEQSPREIRFIYRSATASTELEQVKSQIDISIMWTAEDNTEMLEHQYGAKKDENGYIFNPDKHFLFRQLEENCYLCVFAPNYPAVFDFLTRFTNVQKVNVNPNAVIK